MACEIKAAKRFLLKFVQQDVSQELENSTSNEASQKVHGRFKRLSPFKDDNGIWRVGLCLREYAPFTADGKPPAFVPNDSRLVLLLMEQAHARKHSGVVDTTTQFRLNGY